MVDHKKPTSEWEHSHAIEEGDVLIDEEGQAFEVEKVGYRGSVEVRKAETDQVKVWSEFLTCESLKHGDIHRQRDGLSHELASF